MNPLSLPQQCSLCYYSLRSQATRWAESFHPSDNYIKKLYQTSRRVKGALVDLGHKSAFDLLLKEACNPEVAAMGNSTLPTVCDKLNVMSTMHLRKLAATLVRDNGQREAVIDKLGERIGVLESRLNEIKNQPKTDAGSSS